MADFTSGFWDLFITVLTIAGVFGCAVLLYMQSSEKLEPGQKASGTGHVWDEDLTELNTPMPRWWRGQKSLPPRGQAAAGRIGDGARASCRIILRYFW